jgi:hypothetical protein
VILPLLKIIFDGTKVMISMKTNDIPGSVLETNPPSAAVDLAAELYNFVRKEIHHFVSEESVRPVEQFAG